MAHRRIPLLLGWLMGLLLAGCARQPAPLPTVEPAQWQAGTVQQVSTIATDTYTTTAGRVTSLALSPDGRTVAVGRDDASLTLWDAATGELLRTLPKHSGWVTGLAFSPDGALLASNSDRVVNVWQTETSTHLDAFTVLGDSPRTFLAFAADRRTLAYSNRGGTTGIHDVLAPRHERFASLYREDGPISITPDGSLLAAGDYNGTVKVWDTTTGMLAYNFGEGTMLRWQRVAPQFSSDGTLLAIARSQGKDHGNTVPGRLSLHRVVDGSVLFARQSPGVGSSLTVAFSPDGALLAAGHDTGAITLWRVADGALLQTFGTHDSAVFTLAFSADGRVLLSGSDTGEIIRWHPSDLATLPALPTAVPMITPPPTVMAKPAPSPAPSPTPHLDATPPAPEALDPVEPLPSDTLLLADETDLVALTTSGRELARLALPEAHQYPEITLSSDGRWLVYRDDTQRPIVLKLPTGQRWRVTDPALVDALTEPSFSPDSRLLTYRVSDARRWQVRALDLEHMAMRVLLEGQQDERRAERGERQVAAGIIRETALLDLRTRFPTVFQQRSIIVPYLAPDGSALVVVEGNKARYPWAGLHIYSPLSGKIRPLIPLTDGSFIPVVVWSPDSQRIAALWNGWPRHVSISTRTGTTSVLQFPDNWRLYDLAWLDTAQLLVLASDHATTRLYAIATDTFGAMRYEATDGIGRGWLPQAASVSQFDADGAVVVGTFSSDARILYVPR